MPEVVVDPDVGLMNIVDATPPEADPLPRVMCARDFIAAERSPLEFIIDGVLPKLGKMTLSAAEKMYKSFWAIQTGLAMAAGDCEFLGYQFGPSVRVLYLQAEICDQLLERRLYDHIIADPGFLDIDRAAENFFAQEIATGAPNLAEEEGLKLADLIIKRTQPEVLILDPLYAMMPGLEENAAESMGGALRIIGDVANQNGCATSLIHHMGKAGGSGRGSSVFGAWGDSDLRVSPISDEDNSIVKVVSKLRCAYGGGPRYWRTPEPGRIWFEAMPEGWEPEKKGGRPGGPGVELIPLIFKASSRAGMKASELVEQIMTAGNCKKRKAYELIAEAKEEEILLHSGGIYALKK